MLHTGKIAIVTGATSGIGKATAEQLAAQGARVAVVGRNREAGEAVVSAIDGRHGAATAIFIAADLARPADTVGVVQQTVEAWGRVDILVSNAAVMTFKPVIELEEADWDLVQNVNLKAAFLLAKHAVPHMSEGGAIVNVSSVHAIATSALAVPYAASKGGLEAFTRGLAVEMKPRGIRVNAVRLGAIDTPMLWDNPNVKSGAEQVDSTMVGRPEDVAATISFLAGPGAAFITGTVLDVDGGRLAHL
jgi:glucose 1-dehydrogenase